MGDAGIYFYQIETSTLASGLIDGEIFILSPGGYAYPKDMHGYASGSLGTLQFHPLNFIIADANANYAIGTLTFVPPAADIGQGNLGTITLTSADAYAFGISYANVEMNVINIYPVEGSAVVIKYVPIATVTVEEPMTTVDLSNDSGFKISNSIYINGGGDVFKGANTIDVFRTVQYNLTSMPSNTQATFSTWMKPALQYEDQIVMFQGGGVGTVLIRMTHRTVHIERYLWDWGFDAGLHDPTGWSHLVVSIDTTQPVTQNRIKVYLNGARIPLTSQFGELPQNDFNWLTLTPYMYDSIHDPSTGYTANLTQRIACYFDNFTSVAHYNGLLADTYLLSNVAAHATHFGFWNVDTASWEPQAYWKYYSDPDPGPGSFHLTYTNGSNLGADALGKGDFTVTPSAPLSGNISFSYNGVDLPTAPKTFQFNDSPSRSNGTPVIGNYCVLDERNYNTENFYYYTNVHDAALTGTCGISNVTNTAIVGTMAVSSGRWYWEVRPFKHLFDPHYMVGVVDVDAPGGTITYRFPNGWWYQGNTGEKWNGGANTPYSTTYTVGDTIGVALDMDTGNVSFYKNGSSLGVAFGGLGGRRIAPAIASYRNQVTMAVNFGQYPFDYTPPSGHTVLCSTNLPTPTILNPSDHIEFVNYQGTGSPQTIYSTSYLGDVESYYGGNQRVDWQPDLILLKSLDNTDEQISPIMVYDSVRGPGVELSLSVNVNTSIEVTDAAGITEFLGGPQDSGAPAFSIGGNHLYINRATPASLDYWGWMFNKSAGAGFDIVGYTGTGVTRTIDHSLKGKPDVVIIKDRDDNSAWVMWHKDAVKKYANTVVYLNHYWGQAYANTTYFNATAPTTTQFTVGSHPWVNKIGHRYITYLFRSIPGFSQFGCYRNKLGIYDPEGYTTGSSYGSNFVYTGFTPKFVWAMGFSGYPQLAPSSSSPYSDLYTYPNGPVFGFSSGSMWSSSSFPNLKAHHNSYPGQPIHNYLNINSTVGQRYDSSGITFHTNGFAGVAGSVLYFAWADTNSKYARGRGN